MLTYDKLGILFCVTLDRWSLLSELPNYKLEIISNPQYDILMCNEERE